MPTNCPTLRSWENLPMQRVVVITTSELNKIVSDAAVCCLHTCMHTNTQPSHVFRLEWRTGARKWNDALRYAFCPSASVSRHRVDRVCRSVLYYVLFVACASSEGGKMLHTTNGKKMHERRQQKTNTKKQKGWKEQKECARCLCDGAAWGVGLLVS